MNFLLSKGALLRRFEFLRCGLERTLALSCLFGIAMVGFRIAYTGNWRFASLVWNLLLAFAPYWMTRQIARQPRQAWPAPRFALAFVCWLLFLPNAFYIVTDLFHLYEQDLMPPWFDLAMIFSFAWNGLLFGVLSLRQMEKEVAARWRLHTEIFFVYPVMALNAFGIYLGRYLRFNSWDVVTNPFSLAQEVLYLLVHPLRNRHDWSMIVCYAVLMSLVYSTVKRLRRVV